ncbi:MAG: GntR family transcriptional regulator [Solirubrobacterales bacterium]|nr:GntR family transcriptional regulator [Solirubrobacterales bacterium]
MARNGSDVGGKRALSHADRVYAGLREQLLRGDLPVGRRLVEQQLAADFDTSRTPVREALRRLEGDGHIVRGPGGGLSPSAPSVKSMRELYEVRVAIEELVARRAATAGDRGRLESIERDWRTLEAGWHGTSDVPRGPDFVHVDEAFHLALAGASGNDVAEVLLGDMNDRIRILRVHDFTTDDRIAATIAEHREILGRVLAGDADAAAAFMRAHVQRSALVVRERVGEALARMFELP